MFDGSLLGAENGIVSTTSGEGQGGISVGERRLSFPPPPPPVTGYLKVDVGLPISPQKLNAEVNQLREFNREFQDMNQRHTIRKQNISNRMQTPLCYMNLYWLRSSMNRLFVKKGLVSRCGKIIRLGNQVNMDCRKITYLHEIQLSVFSAINWVIFRKNARTSKKRKDGQYYRCQPVIKIWSTSMKNVHNGPRIIQMKLRWASNKILRGSGNREVKTIGRVVLGLRIGQQVIRHISYMVADDFPREGGM